MGCQKIFNQAHSSLRMVIEQTFGMLKKRWKIVRDIPDYPFQKQVTIIIATMTLHNYIRKYDKSDHHFEKEWDVHDDDVNEEIENYWVLCHETRRL